MGNINQFLFMASAAAVGVMGAGLILWQGRKIGLVGMARMGFDGVEARPSAQPD